MQDTTPTLNPLAALVGSRRGADSRWSASFSTTVWTGTGRTETLSSDVVAGATADAFAALATYERSAPGGTRSQTWVSMIRSGAKAYRMHVQALHDLLDGPVHIGGHRSD